MKKKLIKKENKKYPEGHFVGMWMVIGMIMFSGFGLVLSISTDNPGLIGIGPAIGMVFGLSIGTSIEDKMKKQGKIRPLTKKEKKRKKRAFIVGLIALALGIVVFLVLLLLVK